MIKPGNPCIKLKPEYERINKGISLPKLVDLECKDIIVLKYTKYKYIKLI